MSYFVQSVFGTGEFVPRSQCGDWTTPLIFLHVISDILIWLSYMAIPVVLIYFAARRSDVPFNRIFWMFGLFIVSCGLTHLIDAFAFYSPMYRLGGVMKAITAAASLATVWGLIKITPEALALPALKTVNEQLRQEVEHRRAAEAMIKRLNGDLARRIEESEAILNTIPVGVAVAADASCREIRMNALGEQMLRIPRGKNASLSGPQAGELPFRVFLGDRELPPDELPMQRCARTGLSTNAEELDIVFADGSREQWLEYATPLFDESARVRGCVAAFIDISHRKRDEAARRELEHNMQRAQKLEMLGVLAGGIAHDFNNLLVGMLGNANLAVMSLPESNEARGFVARIEESARRASELTRQMLAYSGKGRFIVTNVNLNRLVDEMLRLLQASISKKARLVTEFDAAIADIEGDAGQISQVIMNLITNASDALADNDGVLQIRTGTTRVDESLIAGARVAGPAATPGEYVFVEVCDTGCGMDQATIERMFDPFFTTKFTGRGLGLAAVGGIVRGHGGIIVVRSEVGSGTTFRVLFPPTAHPTNRALPTGAPPATASAVVSTRTILIVDDEEVVRDVTAHIFRRAGFQVLTAADGDQAIEAFRRERSQIDLLLLDVTMPRKSGHEVYDEVRKLSQATPIVLTSGYNEQDAVLRLSRDSLVSFIQKPFSATALVEKANQMIELAQRRATQQTS